MRIIVRAKPMAREEKVEKIGQGLYSVSVKEPPIRGQANETIRGAPANYLNVSKFQVHLVSGFSSKTKTF